MEKNFKYLAEGHYRADGLGYGTSVKEMPDKNGDLIVFMDGENNVVARHTYRSTEPESLGVSLQIFEDWIIGRASQIGGDLSFTVYAWTEPSPNTPLEERLQRFDQTFGWRDG